VAPPDHQLTYRLIKTEAKLLKVIFEINGYRHIESSQNITVTWSAITPPLSMYDNL
jgi:hypothetical protein